jgi:hypothetical protein
LKKCGNRDPKKAFQNGILMARIFPNRQGINAYSGLKDQLCRNFLTTEYQFSGVAITGSTAPLQADCRKILPFFACPLRARLRSSRTVRLMATNFASM